MNFTRSVAVSSIVGHILGIGDRHLGNILVDQGSGEVVHIDFGFVFEQGKVRAKATFLVKIRSHTNVIFLLYLSFYRCLSASRFV